MVLSLQAACNAPDAQARAYTKSHAKTKKVSAENVRKRKRKKEEKERGGGRGRHIDPQKEKGKVLRRNNKEKGEEVGAPQKGVKRREWHARSAAVVFRAGKTKESPKTASESKPDSGRPCVGPNVGMAWGRSCAGVCAGRERNWGGVIGSTS